VEDGRDAVSGVGEEGSSDDRKEEGGCGEEREVKNMVT
jgi:hypothetical protein